MTLLHWLAMTALLAYTLVAPWVLFYIRWPRQLKARDVGTAVWAVAFYITPWFVFDGSAMGNVYFCVVLVYYLGIAWVSAGKNRRLPDPNTDQG